MTVDAALGYGTPLGPAQSLAGVTAEGYEFQVTGNAEAAAALLRAGDDLTQARAHLRHALKCLKAKRYLIDLMWAYYDGDHPALWLTTKLQDTFGARLATNLQDNFCDLAVDALVHRLNVSGWADREEPGETANPAGTPEGQEVETDEATDLAEAMAAEAVWSDNDLDMEQEDLYRHSMIAGSAYAIVWPRQGGGYDIAANDARTVHVEYGSLKRTDRKWAAKVWWDSDRGVWSAVLYYPDRIVRLTGDKSQRADATDLDPDRFGLDPQDAGGPHAFGKVPVVPFDRRRNGPSRLKSLVPIQDKINKLASNKMVAAEFGAFRQRYFLTTQNLDSQSLRNSPDHAIVLDPGLTDSRTQVGEFDATPLANYDQSIDAEIDKFFTVALLPRALRHGSSTRVPATGEGIKADEGPFVALADSYVKRFSAAWTDVMELCGLNVEPVWAETHVNSDLGTGQTVKAYTDAGAPLPIVLAKYAGWTEQEVDEVRAEAQAAKAEAKQAQIDAMRAFDAGGDTPAGPDTATPAGTPTPPEG